MTAVNGRVLVLNKNWQPINVLPVMEAIKRVIKGRAVCLDIENGITFDYENWCLTWDDAIKTAKIAADQAIRTGNGSWVVLPEVIICTEYRGFGYRTTNRKPKFSRTNIYRRDRQICQFCGKKFPTEELSLDHIVPKSKGGQMTWTNIVLACTSCNGKKDNKSLKECGMKLIRKPFEPTADQLKRSPMERLMYKVGRSVPKTWEQFLGAFINTVYWHTELKE